MAGEGACPSAVLRAQGFRVHRSAGKTLDSRSGRIRRRVWPGRDGESLAILGERIQPMSLMKKDHSRIARSPIGERCEHLRSCLLNISKTVRQRFLVSIPELDVVACGRTSFEPDGIANDKGGRFGFGFADFARRLF